MLEQSERTFTRRRLEATNLPYPQTTLLRLLEVTGTPVAVTLEQYTSQVPHGLWGRHDVEGHGQSGALLKVLDPEFTPRELPLDVRLVLNRQYDLRTPGYTCMYVS